MEDGRVIDVRKDVRGGSRAWPLQEERHDAINQFAQTKLLFRVIFASTSRTVFSQSKIP